MKTASHNSIPARHFSGRTLRSLLKQRIVLVGMTVIPGAGPLPFATGETGYEVSFRGTHRVLRFSEILHYAG